MKKILYITLALLIVAPIQARKPRHVLVIAIDGLSTEGLKQAKTPRIDAYLDEAMYTFTSRNVIPSVTLPNWTSHLTGSGPERHGVLNNKWTRQTAELDAVSKDEDGYYPSIFKVLKEEVEDIQVGYYWDWEPLINSMNPRYMDEKNFDKNEDYARNCQKAFDFMTANWEQPTFVFLYTVGVDHAGHKNGWMSKSYIQAIEKVDATIGTLFDRMQENEMYDDSYIIFMTDHGGINKGHGGYSDAEMRIPFAIKGPHIRPGEIPQQHFTVNTAPIIARIFRAETPDVWAGRCNIRIR
ncbi:MAG: alkaline phosphatase family protein [Bacteroidaceae bacterium]|nr:alkaline phosphatase family protein [Bacteroidaceae bacterium]